MPDAVTVIAAARRAALLAVVALVAAACNGSEDRATPTSMPPVTEDPQPTTTTALTTTTTGVPRTTTTVPVDITPGNARISGAVLGPEGPVAGATVRVERLVGSEVATSDVNAPNGSFSLVAVRGGRYRLRAWKQPDLFQSQAEVFFLAADENKTVDLRLTKVSEVNVQTTVAPDPPPPEEPFTITVFLYAGMVNDQGIVQANPRAGQEVQIAPGPGLALASPERATTDAGGRTSFQARCRMPGPQSADLLVSPTIRVPLTLPACR